MELTVTGLNKWRRSAAGAAEATQVPLLRDVSLRAQSGRLTMVAGPEGAGKTLLLRCLAGLEELDSGEIRLDGRRIDRLPVPERSMAMIGHDFALWPHLSVSRQIAAGVLFRQGAGGRWWKGKLRADVEDQVRLFAEACGVERLLERYPQELAPPEAFRVALARSFASRPRVLLLDDPLTSFPTGTRQELVTLVRRLLDEMDLTPVVIWSVADAMTALALADEVVYLSEGQVLQGGAPEALYTDPRHLAVARGFSPLPPNVLEARAVSSPCRSLRVPALGEWELPLAEGEAAGVMRWMAGEGKGRDVVLVCVRPEQILLGSDPGGFPTGSIVTPEFKVAAIQFQGWYKLVELAPAICSSDTARICIRAVVPATLQLQIGDQYFLAWSPGHQYLFDPVSERRIDKQT
ncbi:MAG: ABC transporter ATP-binding protein [Limnochordales bacterium]|nr:ABC transporter ATP-binding protein [Limnochordales bacterium]